MKTNLELVGAYKRYVASLKEKRVDVIKNFDAMYKFIDQNSEGEIYQVLMFDCIGKTLRTVKDKGIRLKDDALDWNADAVERCFEILDNIKKAKSAWDWDTYKINLYYLFKLAQTEESPHTRLYIYMKHQASSDGANLYKSNKDIVKDLFLAKTNEEIDEILNNLSKKG